MGTKIALPETFTSSTGKVLLDDAILPVTGGALILMDCNHSLGGLGTGDGSVPADLGAVPNIAWKQVVSLLGAGDASSLSLIFDRADGANFNLERTGKKGLHGYLSGNLANGVGLVINMPTAIRDYLYAHLDHDIYFSAWDRVTRVATVAGSVWPMFEGIQRTVSSTANYLGFFDAQTVGDGAWPSGAKRLGARVTPARNQLGNTFRNIAVTDWTGTAPASQTEIRQYLAQWGNLNAYAGAFAGGAYAPSFILYRMYLEDLTVSGRTHAEVDTIDYAMWQAAFAAGGKFYGDTFTASPI